MKRSGDIFVRAITKIKAGEEISWCYDENNCIMKKRQSRQKYIKEGYNFICACNYCKDGKEDIEAFEAFEKFNKNEKRFKARMKEMSMNYQSHIVTEKIQLLKKAIGDYKDIYNFGKKKKASVSVLYSGVYLPWKIITINDHIHNCWVFSIV